MELLDNRIEQVLAKPSLQTEISFGEMFRDRKNVSKRKRVIAPDKFASNDDDDDDNDGNNNNSVVDDDDDDKSAFSLLLLVQKKTFVLQSSSFNFHDRRKLFGFKIRLNRKLTNH